MYSLAAGLYYRDPGFSFPSPIGLFFPQFRATLLPSLLRFAISSLPL